MKYLIKQRVVNGDHIIEAYYVPETPDDADPNDRPSACAIRVTTGDEIRLRGVEADRFWEAYSGDAYAVVTK